MNDDTSTFAFHPELFEHRATAIDALAEHECYQYQDFGAVDLLHDEYGLEVCGIATEGEAWAIARILRQPFPAWPFVRVSYQDQHSPPDWKAEVWKLTRN